MTPSGPITAVEEASPSGNTIVVMQSAAGVQPPVPGNANSPGTGAFEDVCSLEELEFDSPNVIERPVATIKEVTLEPGQEYIFGFDKETPIAYTQQGNDLIITFDCGGVLILKNYVQAVSNSDPATFAFSDIIPLGVLGNLVDIVTLEEQKKLEEELLEKQYDKSGGDEISHNVQDAAIVLANLQPGAGNQPSAQQLAMIQPAAGGQPAGSAQNSGYGFSSSFSSAPVGPLNPIGPLGATLLNYNANFPDPGFSLFSAPDPGAGAENSVDETNLAGGPVIVTGSISIDFGADGPGAVVGNGNFFSSGSQTGGALTSNNVPVVVTYDSATNTYTGAAGGVTVFTLVVDAADGDYTFTQFEQIDHADGADPNDVIDLTFGIDASDSDGDTISTTITIHVADDAPALITPDTNTRNERDLTSGPIVITDTLVVDYGQDVPGTLLPNGNATASGALAGGVLSSGGVPVVITQTATGYVGTAGGVNIFTITVNNTGAYTFTLNRPLDHSSASDTITLNFGVTATDYDGDRTSSAIIVNITDDVPSFGVPGVGSGIENIDETNLGPITVNGTLNITQGADAPVTLTPSGTFASGGSQLGGVLTVHGVPVVVTQTANGYVGTVGGVNVFTLTFNNAGNYTFVLNQALDHNDPNNPNDVINLTFGVRVTDSDGDAANGTIQINVADDVPIAVNDGNFTSSTVAITGNVLTNDDPGSDAVPVVTAITFGGVTTAVPPGGSATVIGVFGTLTINSNGAYSYVADGDADGVDVFTYTMRDYDSDPSQANLTINVNIDNVPIMVQPEVVTVDETNLTPTTSISDFIQADFLTDAPGTFSGTGTFTGGPFTSHGQPVTVSFNAGTNTYTGTAGGSSIFTLAITNVNTGAYTFTLIGTLDHPNTADPNDMLTMNFGVRASDSDNDSVTGNITVNVLDDGPSVTTPPVLSLNENPLGGTVSGTVVHDFGEDGAGAINTNGTFSATGDVAGGTLRSGGVAVVVTNTPTGYVGTAGGVTVFTLNISNTTTGAYTFTLNRPLDHVAGGGANPINLNFGALVRDFDGDTVNTTIAITIVDSVPSFPGAPGVGSGIENVDETNLGPITVGGTLNISTGSDTPVTLLPTGTSTPSGSMAGGALTSGGVPVIITPTGTGYVGMAGATTVFTLTINNNGAYSFTLNRPLDHGDPNNPNDIISIDFGVRVTDNDGDSATGNIRINIADDAPTAVNDSNSGGVGQTLTGNVITNDDISNDAPNTIAQVVHNGTTYIVPPGGSVAITTPTGILTINSNGTYSFPVTSNGVVQNFTYTLTDAEGDTSTAVLAIEPEAPVVPSVSIGDAVIKEDSSGNVAVNASYTGGNGNEVITLTISGVPAGWGVGGGWTSIGGGQYTRTLAAGVNTFSGNITLTPPANSDADIPVITVNMSVANPGQPTTTASDTGNVIVDAVADAPWLSVSGGGHVDLFVEDSFAFPINVSTGVTDTDGSEVIQNIQIHMWQPGSHIGAVLSFGGPDGSHVYDFGIGAMTGSVGGEIWVPAVGHGTSLWGNTYSYTIPVYAYSQEAYLTGAEVDYSDNTAVAISATGFSVYFTPLVLDMNGNGIELLNIDDGVMFDMNNNGTLDHTAWAAPTDALLAIDLNGDGIINNRNELFGDNAEANATNGFQNLAQYDLNGDGVINAQDNIFSNLIIWQDLNSDGISDANEMRSLSDWAIASINVNATETGYGQGDSYITHESSFTFEDGTEHQIVDAWFKVDEGGDDHLFVFVGGTNFVDGILGSEGRDFFIGGKGNDIIKGNGGNDVYAYASLNDGKDTILDFNAGDQLDISAILEGYDPLQDSITDFVFKTETDAGTTIYVDAHGSGNIANATAIAFLSAAHSLNLEQITNNGHVTV